MLNFGGTDERNIKVERQKEEGKREQNRKGGLRERGENCEVKEYVHCTSVIKNQSRFSWLEYNNVRYLWAGLTNLPTSLYYLYLHMI